MNIFVPFTKLRSETYSALPGCVIVPLTDRVKGYGKYFRDRWREGKSFINVEQDVLPTQEMISEISDCQSEICFSAYAYPGQPERIERGTYLGCVKISDQFIQRNPTLFDNDMDWTSPEGVIWNASDSPCHHGPVLHLHVDSNWPMEEINRYG